MVGTNDLEKSSKFYDAVFVHLGLKKISTAERMIAYARSNDPREIKFYITKPQNKKPATIGNGTMIALLAESKEAVNKFHTTDLINTVIMTFNLWEISTTGPTNHLSQSNTMGDYTGVAPVMTNQEL